jgi:ABC-2 type transport system ATP-binding protein
METTNTDYGSMPPPVEVNGVVKFYGNVPALRGLTFRLEPGERCALLGPNGAGKSTTLKILVGLLTPDEGSAIIDSYNPTSIPARKLIGYLPEDASPYRTLTVRENLEYIAALREVPNISYKVDKLMEIFHLREYERAKVGRLSRGNVQKLALALSIVHDPSVIFLDEPLNYLDIPTQEDVIVHLNSLKATQLVSTHIMGVASRLADRVIMIAHGVVIWSGALAELRKMGKEDESIETVVAKMLVDVR